MKLDEKAYDIISNWPEYTNFDPVFDGIDYSLIIRFYLWDKVGRALRLEKYPAQQELEYYKKEYRDFPFYYNPRVSKGYFKKKFFDFRKRIFIPFQLPHTRNLIEDLQKKDQCYVISKFPSDQIKPAYVIREESFAAQEQQVQRLYHAVLEALEVASIKLTGIDKKLLHQQINGSFLITALAEKELKKNKPHLLYVHSDNHPPFINYILAAKKLGIPTLTYQHGLDCEQYLLDDCFADHVAVWSEHRREQYIGKSSYQPRSYAVLGNNLFNPFGINPSGGTKNLLFITRPHRPVKCYSPYRKFTEGRKILKVIVSFMAENPEVNLIVKIHPMDMEELYLEEIYNSGLEDRISISSVNIVELLQKTDVIITEDSTAGVESMYYEIPCIFAHLTDAVPVIPFADSGAALNGNSEEELLQSLVRIFTLTDNEKNSMKIAQRKLRKELLPLGNVQALSDFLISKL